MLAGAFQARGGIAAEEGLEAALHALVERGRARWPAFTIEPVELASEIGARVRSQADLEKLQIEDLQLAVACARGMPGAIEAFDREHLMALSGSLRRIDASPAFLQEVRQVVRERLFVPPPGKIVEYSGRGALGAWTRVVAVRAALDLRPRAVEREAREPELATAGDPELRYLQQKYGPQFEAALKAAFAALDDEQVNLLRLQIVDGLATGQIAALFKVTRSTIKRRLAACREALLSHTRAALRDELGLSPQSFESLARLLTSQLHLSVARLLKDR